MPPDPHPPPPPPFRRRPSPAAAGNAAPRLLRRQPPPTTPAPQTHKPASATPQSSWELFFSESPPPPPRHGQPLSDEVDWVPPTPDPSSASADPVPATSPPHFSYADAVRCRLGKSTTRQRPDIPAFTAPRRQDHHFDGSTRQRPVPVSSARRHPASAFTPPLRPLGRRYSQCDVEDLACRWRSRSGVPNELEQGWTKVKGRGRRSLRRAPPMTPRRDG